MVRLDGPAPYPGSRKRFKYESVRTKALLVWPRGNRKIFSEGPKLSSRSSPSSTLLESHGQRSAHTWSFRRSFVLQRSVPISVPARWCSRAHTFWYVTMVVTIETTTPKRRARKSSFWSTLDTLIFQLFSNRCCLGYCAAVASLKQMLANNCYETHERSVVFDLGPRTITHSGKEGCSVTCHMTSLHKWSPPPPPQTHTHTHTPTPNLRQKW